MLQTGSGEVARFPERADRSSMVTITLLMLAILLWQTLAFSLTAHMLLDEMHRVHPEPVAVAALPAGMLAELAASGVMLFCFSPETHGHIDGDEHQAKSPERGPFW